MNVDSFEGGLLIQCDLVSKIMRTETVLDVLTTCFQKDKINYRESALKALLGGNVVTR